MKISLHTTSEGIVVFATNPGAVAFISELLNQPEASWPIHLFTDPDHPLDGPSWWANSARLLTYTKCDPQKLLKRLREFGSPLGFVIGWHEIFKPDLIDFFEGRLINIHAGNLPRYRGAGGGSWQVLNGEKQLRGTAQVMAVAVDAGPVLHHEIIRVEKSSPYPVDIKRAQQEVIERVGVWLARSISAGFPVELREQQHEKSRYFPRLNTKRDGWIDFRWRAHEVERFVRAFSDPYQGASFRYHDDIFRVRRARVGDAIEEFHPFCNGIILAVCNNELYVALHDGVLVLSEIDSLSGESTEVKNFRVGQVLWTSERDRLGRLGIVATE